MTMSDVQANITVLALCGPIASGKTTLADAIHSNFGTPVISTKKVINKMFGDGDRVSMQNKGAELDESTRGTWIVNEVRDISAETRSPVVIVDSIRTDYQISALNNAFGKNCVKVFVTANDGILCDRFTSRDADHDKLGYANAKKHYIEKAIYGLIPHVNLVVDSGSVRFDDYYRQVAGRLGLTYKYRKCVDIVVGGQYGSEGKGQVVAYLADVDKYDLLIRSGGPNAGHKVWEPNGAYCFHHIPSGTRVNKNAHILLGPACVLWAPGVLKEIEDCGLDGSRLSIDPRAMIIEGFDRDFEGGSLVGQIGSTGQGVGAAASRKILRNHDGRVKIAKDIKEFEPFIRNCSDVIESYVANGAKIMGEGTQGTMLSLFHGPYPYCTSRDTTAGGLASELGISMNLVNKVVSVCRVYPIRVQSPEGGTSGPMAGEIDLQTISDRSGIPMSELQVTETTSTTKKKRRIAEFDWEMFARSCFLNGPTDIACTFTDYLSVKNRDAKSFDELTEETLEFFNKMERVSGASVSLASIKFHHPDGVLDRRSWRW